jgi:hypothetical protein
MRSYISSNTNVHCNNSMLCCAVLCCAVLRAGFDLGQPQDMNYFRGGEAGYHSLWDSRCLNYGHWEVQRYLLSNLRYWLDEYQFDGFRWARWQQGLC